LTHGVYSVTAWQHYNLKYTFVHKACTKRTTVRNWQINAQNTYKAVLNILLITRGRLDNP